MEKTILKSDFETLVDIFFSAKKQLVLSIPNLQVELADALIELHGKGLNIVVFLEFSEETYRQGYGEIEALNILLSNGIEIRKKQGFNIYFIMYDEEGFFYFPKSFFFEKEGTAYDLVPMMDKQVNMMKVLLGLYYDSNNEQIQEVIQEVGLDKINEVSKSINYINDKELNHVNKKLKDDPVRKPGLTRHLEVYRSKFQIIELEFKGANLNSKRVKLPKKALPFKDKELLEAIESNIKLFTVTKDNGFLNPFFELKHEVETIREKYLFRLKSRNKSIIKRDELGEFNAKLATVKEKMTKLNEELSNDIQKEIGNTRLKIEDNLFTFLLANPPEEYKNLKGDVLKAEIDNDVHSIVSRIHFPKAHQILEKMRIIQRPYELTWEDLNDQEVLNDMLEKKLITEHQKAYFEQVAFEAVLPSNQLDIFNN